ncbi:MAG: sigma factor-like helix-turn-helix DNA-binding protein, partial [Bacteroidota bacterium]
ELLASATTKSYDQETVFGGLMEDEVQQALAELPLEFRSVIILSDLEDCTHAEIAEILGCPRGTVASRLFRGRQLLRESLEAYAKRRGLL